MYDTAHYDQYVQEYNAQYFHGNQLSERGLLHSPRKGDTSSQFGIVASLR